MLIEEDQEDNDPDVDKYVPDFVPSNDDCENLDDRVSFIWFLPAYRTVEEKEELE